MIRLFIALLLCASFGYAGPRHKRDGSNLPAKEQEFSHALSIRERKIFCGQFNHEQRQAALKYARGRAQDQCLTPDQAVRKVMEETGMSLVSRGRAGE